MTDIGRGFVRGMGMHILVALGDVNYTYLHPLRMSHEAKAIAKAKQIHCVALAVLEYRIPNTHVTTHPICPVARNRPPYIEFAPVCLGQSPHMLSLDASRHGIGERILTFYKWRLIIRMKL